MFSKVYVVRLLKIFVLSLVLVGLFFVVMTTRVTVQAAVPQEVALTAVHSEKVEPVVVPAVNKIANTEVFDATQPVALFSVSNIHVLRPEEWKTWDIVPSMTPNTLSIYKRGLAMGKNPHAFSKVGDGEISAAWFLTDFDLGADHYDLRSNVGLQATVSYFAGSFNRQSQAARRGFNTQRVLDPSLAGTEFCQTNETPLDCEIRIHHPSFAVISMGTNQVWQPEQFESGMRKIIETLIKQGVVPVLSTKADNLEGDHRINFIVARLAVEYDIPVWNFWRAVQSLPNSGLQKDREHLTYFPNDFSSPNAMQYAWPVRNLTALQVLERLMKDTQN